MRVDQVRRLHGSSRFRRVPLRNDDRPWIRWPVVVWQTCGGHTLAKTLSRYYINALLVFTPLGILAGTLGWNPIAIFVLNCLGTIPLVALLNFAIDELSPNLGYIGGIINGCFGRPFELIIGLIALRQNSITLAQSSMIGSILFNTLLVLGSSLCIGGTKYTEQPFATVTSKMSALLVLASTTFLVPAFIYAAFSSFPFEEKDLVSSHGFAIILLFIYFIYLRFQLRTPDVFGHSNNVYDESDDRLEDQLTNNQDLQTLGPIAASFAIVLLLCTVCICTEFLLGAIYPVIETSHLSVEFIATIVIPFVGNGAELSNTWQAALNNRMDLVISLAIGNSLQIALLITPCLVISGWLMDRNMTMHFNVFEAICLYVSTVLVAILVRSGKSNYLHGMACLSLYLIIALGFYVYPSSETGDLLGPP